LGAAVVDQDGDEWLDIAVANNTDPNYLYRNNGRGAFREIGMEAGIALSADGSPRAAFGIDSAEIAELGGESLLFGHLNGQMPALYQRDRGGLFQDATSESGTGPASRPYTSFGTAFADLDNDGRPDILAVNGHLDPDVQQFQGDISYRQPPLFFLNQGGGRFAEAGRALGADFARPLAGRGLALADFDLDGNLDVAITTNGGPLHLLRNRGKSGANAIRLVLEGAGGNRSAIGAWVEVKAGMSTIRRRVKSGGSYLSQSELPLTIGLGEHPMADSVTVHWPGRSKTSVKEVAAGQIVQIQEGAGIVGSRPFRKVP
jgi:hypothetical protein